MEAIRKDPENYLFEVDDTVGDLGAMSRSMEEKLMENGRSSKEFMEHSITVEETFVKNSLKHEREAYRKFYNPEGRTCRNSWKILEIYKRNS
ncbi:hypothetical protein Trydic_g1210 [Trypoxylus dichotomus]